MKQKPKNIYILIVFLAVVVIILIAGKLFFVPQEAVVPILPPAPTPTTSWKNTPTINPSPAPVKGGRGDSPEDLKTSLLKKFPLYDTVPYQEESFSVDYLGPLHLRVVLKIDTPENRKIVLDWIKSNEVDPLAHKIDWITSP